MLTDAQMIAFESGSLGLSAATFSFTIRSITFALVLLWTGWVFLGLGRTWAQGGIDFFQCVTRAVRCVLVLMGYAFFLS